MSASERTREILAQQRRAKSRKGAAKPWTTWQVSLLCLFGLVVIGVAASEGGNGQHVSVAASRRDKPIDTAYTRAAQRAGWSGQEAEQVGVAAESICLNSAKC